MRIPIDRESHIPLYIQIKDFLKEEILAGSLSANAKLPSTNKFAHDLGINRITVSIIFFINGLYFPILRDLLNKNIPSGKRVTIISSGAMFSCLISTTINPILGRISDYFSLHTAFNALGIGSLLSMSAVLMAMKNETL